jgi:HSP20 family protein
MNLIKAMSQLIKPEPKTPAAPQRVTYVTPLANIIESGEGYVLEAEMPGVGKDGLEVTVENDQLTIVGRRSGQVGNGNALYRESRQHDYRRVFEIDPSIDTAHITAKIDQGVLKLTLPKAEAVKPRRIEVN